MSASKSKSKQPGNTLFSYFTKTPKKDTTPQKSKDVLSPRRSPNNAGKTSPKSASKTDVFSPKRAKTPAATPNGSDEAEYVSGDVVWAKLTGYPWWPSLVCNHPTTKTHVRGSKSKKHEVHVQFFDTPVSRAWVKASNVKPFKGSEDKECQKGGQFYTLNTQIRKHAQEADKALKMSTDEPDIFDAEMSDENDDSIKENKTEDKKEAPEKLKEATPSKKRTRGAKRHAAGGRAKRRRIMEPDSGEEDSGDDFKPDSSSDDDDESASSGVDEAEISEAEAGSEPDSPVKKTSRKRPAGGVNKSSPLSSGTPSSSKSSFQPSVSSATKSKLSLFSAPDIAPSGTDTGARETTSLAHFKFDFLQPDKLRDANRKSPTDPDYDPRTVYVPDSFLSKQTPAMRQWWEMKAKHFDTVLFFKMGKFYELFHMDATTAVEELGLIYMKGDYAHSGFPEIAYSRYADALLQKGYKVARIEQTETPEMMAERCRQMARPTKFDKVVKREICQVATQGIRTFSARDGNTGNDRPNYLLALCEMEPSHGGVVYGVCFVDTSLGTFHLGQFEDDRHSSRLRTVFAHYTPSQILYERSRMSQKTLQLINGHTSALREALSPGKEFWESSKTLKTLLEESYFKEEGEDFRWPETLKKMMSNSDALGLTAADSYDLALRSLGAIVWYLQYCLMDHEVLSMRKFEEYRPLDQAPEKRHDTTFDTKQQHLVLDGVTLNNLEVVENATSGGTEGTLLEQVDTCSTPFGKRLLKQWLCAPLCQPVAVNDRLDAVEELMEMQEMMVEATDTLKKLPDLERLLSRIHSLGVARRTADHPEGRAILYEEVTYSKRKIEDFLSTLVGFKAALKISRKFTKMADQMKSKLLKRTVLLDSETSEGDFPDITEDLDHFDNAFNHEKARKDGVIVPSKGVDTEYDEAVEDMKSKEAQLQDYLEKQRQRLGCKGIVYWGTGKNRYQLEVPEAALKRVPEEYEVMSSKKGAKRYRTKIIENYLAELVDAEERKDAALKDIMRRIFHRFDERYTTWNRAVACLSVLDVLLSLARYSRCSDGVMCRPHLVLPDSEKTPFLEVREGRHPCIGHTFVGGDFIPNDTVIGIRDESGCYVPAEKCSLTPVDRIFTRLGASDRIMSGESTFFVELSETSAVLQHSTEHSLVLMDELGRGTATYDGTAIAYAVVRELSENLRCRSLFSTHYHSLVDQFAHDANVNTGHMACMVENEDDTDPSQETITFLYKFTSGACPKSYGFNAARLASLPEEVIGAAIKKAKEFELAVEQLHFFR
ncbi:hypothetical protein BaRGS_00029664 [Batillaria attramentaria]|uniref:DNA mismatch repair protein n=1 Tax=Batillaria attramentaria TaxID=370345 RepID=A0ABD0JWQ2_9CAEN